MMAQGFESNVYEKLKSFQPLVKGDTHTYKHTVHVTDFHIGPL